MMTCPICGIGESRGSGPFGVVLSCVACLQAAKNAEAIRVKKREERGGTCDVCKKRKAVLLGGSNMTRTMAYRSEHLCAECAAARLLADLDQSAEGFKGFK